MRIAVNHARLGKSPRGAVRLRKPPLAVRAESFLAKPFRLRVRGIVAAAVSVLEQRSGALLAAAVLIAGQVEGALPPLGRRRAGIAVYERGGGAGGGPAARGRVSC